MEPVVLIQKIDFDVPEIIYLALLDKIRKTKKLKIEKFKFRQDALRSLSGELLLKYSFEKYFNLHYDKEIIEEDEFGKPYLKNRNLQFNISHSGNWSVVACYTNKVGIDIERIENPPFEIMQKNFTEKEIEQIEDDDPQVKAEQFFKLWTLKESYIKMLGQGLSIPLDSFSIDISDENAITVKDINRLTEIVNFKLFRPDLEHILAVCMNYYSKEISPRIVSYSDYLP